MPDALPRVLAWELTRRCDLHCRHCRGAARDAQYKGELTTAECFQVVDSIGAHLRERPPTHNGPAIILILTGGEPMLRDDIYDIARRASDAGIFVAMAPCGHHITQESTDRMKAAGIKVLSLSIDAASPASHDRFRGTVGAWDRTLAGIEALRRAGLPYQVNTTVTRLNVDELPAIHDLVEGLAAFRWDLFFLVPTGRGQSLKDLALSADESDKQLRWARSTAAESSLSMKITCAPHSIRIWDEGRQEGDATQHEGDRSPATGCMGGTGFAFISHTGILQPCGFLDVPSGDLRASGFDLPSAYSSSRVFQELRDRTRYHGKCRACHYLETCGGCRARAYAASGDYLDAEPDCAYQPTGEAN